MTTVTVAVAARRARPLSPETTWGIIMLIPYAAVFLLFVVYPIGYGIALGSSPAAYRELFNDPIYSRSMVNTLMFLLVGVNLKLVLALFLSGFLAIPRGWIRAVGVLFILPWAVPSIPTIFSFRWMFNSEWGMINGLIFQLTGEDGPGWLLTRDMGMLSIVIVHIWKYLPFWTLILLAARLSIPKDLYEAAAIDGTSSMQRFQHVTWPHVKNLYITSTLLSTIWTLGDFNSIYLLTGGGPVESTHVLATLGIRYAFQIAKLDVGVATVITALPIVVPLVVFLIRRLGRGPAV